MLNLRFFVEDDRQRAPTVLFVETADEARACEIASEMLRRSPHHRGIEVLDGESRLFGIGSCAERSIIDAASRPPRAEAHGTLEPR